MLIWLADRPLSLITPPQNIYAESRELFDRAMYSPAAEGFQNVISKVDSETDLAEQSSFFYVLCGIKLMNRDAGDQVLRFLSEYPHLCEAKRIDFRNVRILIQQKEVQRCENLVKSTKWNVFAEKRKSGITI